MDSKNNENLKQSYQDPQIIPSGKVGGIRITLRSENALFVRERISYIINKHHIFNIMVTAEVVEYDLKLNSHLFNFKFEEDSLQMTTKE